MALLAAEEEFELPALVEALTAAPGRVGAAEDADARVGAEAAHGESVERDARSCATEAER